MNLYKAHDQWQTRPSDERFESLKDMYAATNGYREFAGEAVIRQGDLRVVPTDRGLALQGQDGKTAAMTHWAFGQFCNRMAAPPDYLRSLSPQLAAENLNYCIKDDERDDLEIALLLQGSDDQRIARAFTSTKYSRIWNSDVVARLMDLPKGWRVPPARPARPGQPGTRPATKADIVSAGSLTGGLIVKVGDPIAPAGLYASDHDMFAFMVNEEHRLKIHGSKTGLARGFFAWNSEVGASSFGLMTFLYDAICGNHICWGVQNVTETRIRHVGKANDKAFEGLQAEVIRYAEESTSEAEARIRAAQRFKLGKNKDEVLDAIFKYGIAGLTKNVVNRSYDMAELHSDAHGDPRTVWGMVSGITRISQEEDFGDGRTHLDRAAGRLLAAF